MSDCPEMMIAMLGVMGMGAIVVPCSTMLKPAEIEYMLKDSGAKLVIVTPEHLENAKAAHAPKIIDDLNQLLENAKPAPLGSFTAETPCLILYTSGSTGSPKGAVHLHDHLPETIERVAKVVYKLGPDDRIFSSSRLFFAYGLGNSFSFPIGSGCSVVLCSERPTPQLIADIFKRHRPTIFFAVPAVFRGLIEYAKQGNKIETELSQVLRFGGRGAAGGDLERVEGARRSRDHRDHRHHRAAARLHPQLPDRNRPGSSGSCSKAMKSSCSMTSKKSFKAPAAARCT